jgi:acetyl esterase
MYLIDPELAMHVAELSPTDFSDVAAARAQMRETAMTHRHHAPERGVTVTDLSVPGAAGDPAVNIRTYTPDSASNPEAGLLYIHGGGFALGDLDTTEAICSLYASEVGAVVVSVGYRLAPEHPFPAALQDCFAVLTWLAEHGRELGVDPTRIAVAGESAGGGLTAALALLARDRQGPRICFQLLEIPVLDDRLETDSMQAFTDTPVWDRRNARLSWELYLGTDISPGDPRVSPYAAPARALDLAGLPPAHIVTAEFDPLRDEGIAYAQRLLAAGVSASLTSYAGTFHGSSMFADAQVSRRILRDTIEALRRGLVSSTASDLSAVGPQARR